jgi:hypothetical protein
MISDPARHYCRALLGISLDTLPGVDQLVAPPRVVNRIEECMYERREKSTFSSKFKEHSTLTSTELLG